MLAQVWNCLSAHPERWIALAGALASLPADWLKRRWPGLARVVDAAMHLVPNLPGAFRALRGDPCCGRKARRRKRRRP